MDNNLNIQTMTDHINKLIKNSDRSPVILIFNASWSSYSSIINVIAKKIEVSLEKSNIVLLEADQCEPLLSKYKIKNIPSCIVIYNHEIIGRLSGLFSKKHVLDIVSNYSLNQP